jgi:hypothetical protein
MSAHVYNTEVKKHTCPHDPLRVFRVISLGIAIVLEVGEQLKIESGK